MSDSGTNTSGKKEAFLTTRDALEHRPRARNVWSPRLPYLNERCNSIMTALSILDEELKALEGRADERSERQFRRG
jgi:hypothetical protein